MTEERELLIEGKTKKVFVDPDTSRLVQIESKDDLTAGDGAKHDVVGGKAELANQTTCNVFRFLQQCGLPMAFVRQLDPITFLAERCRMIPLEVVVRREAHGSFLKRHPYLVKGHYFPKLKVEFFLKTSGKQWNGRPLDKDDPFLEVDLEKGMVKVYRPDQPIFLQEQSQMTVSFDDLFGLMGGGEATFQGITEIALNVFWLLEKAWQILGHRLVDFKIECGVTADGKILLADVIDNDSWRVLEDDHHIDKQRYRDGADLNEVTRLYRQVTDLTRQFSVPRQQVILWRGSEADDIALFENILGHYKTAGRITVERVTCSAHKQPELACQKVRELVKKIPDTVIIAYIGRSNGAGPMLSAQVSVPVITVPVDEDEIPFDIWSSLRMPGSVPLMTVLDPGNAVLAALQILAMRNPVVYAMLRENQEKKFVNTVLL